MAAIFGVVARSPGLDLDAAAAHMQGRLSHRAPDGFTRWKSDGCMLGHGALNIGAPPAQAAQPLRLADGRICVADGFVANFDELRRVLGIDAGLVLADAQLLALAVERWGSAFTDHVQGEFAVALWHPRARTLELVRDHLGGRPVCYVQTPHLFAFATSSLALPGLPGVEARLDPLGIVTLWYYDADYQKQDYTAFEGISALAPAHGLHWDETGGAKQRRYWRMSPQAPVRLGNEQDYVEAFREVFGGAVARAMRGSGGTALMLSGGIDSAAILAARRGFRQGGVADDLLCVSAVLAPGDHPAEMLAENRNILALTQQHPWKSQFKVPATAEPGSLVTPADLAEVALSWIHPGDMSLLVPSLACGLAKREGCRLMLDGVDGDNMTSPGGDHVSHLIRKGRWQRAWSESVQAARVNTYLQGQSPPKLFARALFRVLEPEAIRRVRYRRRTERAIRGVDSHPIMAPELAQRANLPQRLRDANELRFGDEQQRRCDHLAHWLAFSLDGSSQIMSRHGMEARHPWCDMRVLEFFQRLPVEYRVRNGWTKWVVRQACESALGAEVVWHSGKSHLGAFLNRQVLEDAAPYLRGLLEEQRTRLQGYVRDEVVADAIKRLSTRGTLETNDGTVLVIVALAGWLRHAYDQLDRGLPCVS